MRIWRPLVSAACVAAAFGLASTSATAGQITFVGYVTTPTCSLNAQARPTTNNAHTQQQFTSCSAYVAGKTTAVSSAAFQSAQATLALGMTTRLAALGYRPVYRAAGEPASVQEVIRTYQ